MVTVGLLLVLAGLDGPKISVDIPAMSAIKALKEVGAAAHLTLTTSPQTADDILLLRFKDVSVEEAMARIATADDATWKKEGGSFRLIRTRDQVRAEEEAQIQQYVDRMHREIAKKMADLDNLPAWSPRTADVLASKVAQQLKSFNSEKYDAKWDYQIESLAEQAPFGRLMSRILGVVDLREIAQIQPRSKAVWSTTPTASQLPMPAGAIPLINEFLTENSEWSAAAEKWHLRQPTANGAPYFAGEFGDFSSTTASSQNVATVLLSTMLYGRNFANRFELAVYDAKGKRLAETNINLGEYDGADPKASKQSPPDERKVIGSADGDFAVAARNQDNKAWQPLPPAFAAKIADANRYDPLNLFVTPCLDQAATIRGVNLAAHLCDEFGFGYIATAKSPVTVDQCLEYLRAIGAKSEFKDGWLIVQPSRPIEAREVQADRKELTKFLQRCADPKHMSLEERAKFALTMPDPLDNPVPMMLVNYLRLPEANDYGNIELLRFYGLLTTDQKANMAGDGLPCSSLTSAQKQCLNDLVFGVYAYIQYDFPTETGGQQLDRNLYYTGLLHEPTESMPGGIPPKAMVHLKLDESPVVLTGERPVSQYSNEGPALDANTLAEQKFMQDHPELPIGGQKISLGLLRYGTRRRLTLAFQLTPIISLKQSLEDIDQNAFEPVTVTSLPDDFKNAYLAAYDKEARLHANLKPGQGTNTNGNIPPAAR